MKIRFATEADIPGMIDLLQQVGEVHHRIRPDLFRSGAQKYDEAALKALLADPSRPILIADAEGQVAGYCFCIFQETKGDSVLCDRKVLYIDDLCVDERCRGQGIAGALYEKTCAFARRSGCRAVTLNVWCGNDGAMKFYEKMGMKPQKIGMETILEESGC
jgi:ribosomal protein S18 acetylase RimI-like enzyme